MRKTRFRSAAMVMALSALHAIAATRASAQEAPDYARSGPFIGLRFSYGIEDFDRPGDTDVDDSAGFGVYLGQRVDPHFAVGLQWEYMGGFEVSQGSVNSEVVTNTLMADGRFYLLTGRIQPFLQVGFGWVHVDDEEGIFDDGDAFGVRGGGGLEFYLTERVVLSAGADYVVPATDVDDVRYVSVHGGAMFRF